MYEYYRLNNGNILVFENHILICVITKENFQIPKDWKEIKKITGGHTNE